MSKRKPFAKWPLPGVVNPPGRKLITLCIPDEPAHIAAFRGALLSLASASKWQDDTLHTAKDVANVWKEVIVDEGSCLEFRQDDCHLYMVVNGIETLIYNGQECIDALINEGYLNPGVPNDSIGPKPSGTCIPYSFDLQVYEEFYIPQLVSSGDTLSFSNLTGGTTDLLGLDVFWYCPTGAAYLLGACSGPRGSAVTGDPLQTAPHLSLIVRIGSSYYDVIGDGTFVVPEGITSQPCAVLLNISRTLGITASGNVRGILTYCQNAQWCYDFDFTTSSGNWSSAAGYSSIWSNGNGWQGNDSGNLDRVFIQKAFTDTFIRDVRVTISQSISDPYGVWICPDVVDVSCSGLAHASGQTVFTLTVNDTIDDISLGFERGGEDTSRWGYITHVRFRGTGTNPFGTDNC